MLIRMISLSLASQRLEKRDLPKHLLLKKKKKKTNEFSVFFMTFTSLKPNTRHLFRVRLQRLVQRRKREPAF